MSAPCAIGAAQVRRRHGVVDDQRDACPPVRDLGDASRSQITPSGLEAVSTKIALVLLRIAFGTPWAWWDRRSGRASRTGKGRPGLGAAVVYQGVRLHQRSSSLCDASRHYQVVGTSAIGSRAWKGPSSVVTVWSQENFDGSTRATKNGSRGLAGRVGRANRVNGVECDGNAI